MGLANGQCASEPKTVCPNQLKALKSEWDKEKEEELVEEDVMEYIHGAGRGASGRSGKGRCAATRGGKKGKPIGVIDALVAFPSRLLS